MKTIGDDVSMRIHYSMTYEEAQLLNRITDGYVALARYLTTDVKVRFPESADHISKLLRSLMEGTHEAIARCDATARVHAGRDVAIDPKRLQRLEEMAAELAALKKTIEPEAERTDR